MKLNIKTSFLPQVDTSFTHYYEASHLVTLGQIFYSRGRPVKFFIAFLDEIGNSKSFEANLQNSSGRPVGFLEDVQ